MDEKYRAIRNKKNPDTIQHTPTRVHKRILRKLAVPYLGYFRIRVTLEDAEIKS